MENASIFLTTREAIQTIITDFRQYNPQIILFSSIIRLITNNQIHLKRAPAKNGVWVNSSGTAQMKWLTGPELVEFMCDAISRTRWYPDLLAAVSARVFQARATSEVDADSGEVGVRIETNMEDFRCRQCGDCCRYLDYHNEVTAGDVAFWKASGRNDILEWIDEISRNGHMQGYRAWVIPGTRKEADTCPFLEKEPDSRRWRCRIQDVKPAICRQYPLNRKHAVMSGCRGFQKKSPLNQ